MVEKTKRWTIEDVPEGLREYIQRVPWQNPLVRVERKEDEGTVVLIYKKNFTRFERWLHKLIGGPEYIRRPLDRPGTTIWDLCDGEHTILDIVNEVEELYREDVAPALPRVAKFVQMLRERNLVLLLKEGERPPWAPPDRESEVS